MKFAKAVAYFSSSSSNESQVIGHFKKSGFTVINKPRTHKEKQVDGQISADITELVCDRSNVKGTIVVVSGDQDMIPAIKKGLQHKFQFEIWSWKDSLSREYDELRDSNPNMVSISLLDDIMEKIIFYAKSKCKNGVV